MEICAIKFAVYYVYILQSIKFPHQFYTGFSGDVFQRLKEHNLGKSIYTHNSVPWKLVYYSVFEEKKKALNFEKYLKTASGRAFRNKRLI